MSSVEKAEVCENRGCSEPAVAVAYDDEHDLRPWRACKRHYEALHGTLPAEVRE